MFFDKALTKVFGTANERAIKKLLPMVSQVGALEPEMEKLSDEELRAKTVEFRARIAARLQGITDPKRSRPPNVPLSTKFCLKPSPSSAKPAGAPSRCATSTCS